MNTIQVADKYFEILIENDQIKKRTRLIGIQLNVDYETRCPIFIGVLNGGFMFMADLLKEISGSCEVSFIKVSSYQGQETSGEIKEIFGLPKNLHNRDVIIVEDIIDTGLTLRYILDRIQEQNPASVAICTLLSKPAALRTEINEQQYIGFEIANNFVVGYGLDYDGLGRNLKDIYSAKSV
ncbi:MULTISPECIES: hypoxanthine phosphoribosyltransferase [Pedobacter]|uniref:hypoxanthine phosphoribosyltransferase n=1 Tax=Pedobacter TaxID=84567 RepID=UPI0021096CED|nr:MULTISPECIES: hypoxanthine phosphoribosyltransferase [unclassified Pedobacter]